MKGQGTNFLGLGFMDTAIANSTANINQSIELKF